MLEEQLRMNSMTQSHEYDDETRTKEKEKKNDQNKGMKTVNKNIGINNMYLNF